MARTPTNGPPQTWACPKHPDKTVVLFGLPDATAWCPCGREMKKDKFISMR